MRFLFLLDASVTSSLQQTSALTTSEKWQLSLSTTLTGILIVFSVLVLLTFIISLFGKFGGKKKKAAAPAAQAVPAEAVAIVTAPPAATEKDDDELLAVIAAAVYAYGEGSGKSYQVQSVKRAQGQQKQGRSAWASSGVLDNTRSF